MTAPRRAGRSLFWTFAGAFFLVLLVAGLLQVVLLALFFEPLVERWNVERARSMTRSLAMEIEALPDSAGLDGALDLLHQAGREPGGPRFAFVDTTGNAWHTWTMPFSYRRAVGRLAAGEFMPGGRPGRPGRPTLLARWRVDTPALSGEILALGPPVRLPFLPGMASRRAVAFLPVALLVALVGGLVIFRMIVRRLEALERLAGQVAEGRLDVRVEDAGSDEIGRLGASFNDMTRRLAELRQREAEDERTRRQLLADITHELATPLTSIRGHAETLLDAAVPVSPEERASYLRGILDESHRMSRLIQDLLDLTRLEAGASPLEIERLDLAALARNTVERFQPRFRETGLTLNWRGDDSPVWVDGDGRRLEQVLDNLMINALRYVAAGGTVEAAVTGWSDAGGARARLVVSDDGPGIPEAERARVFDRFYRGDAARARSVGTGLGLSIVREVVTRHGGQARVEAHQPRGTSFVIDLPAAPSA